VAAGYFKSYKKRISSRLGNTEKIQKWRFQHGKASFKCQRTVRIHSLSPQTIYNKINRGDFPIPYKKVFGLLRWELEEVNDFLDKLILQGGDEAVSRRKS